MASFYSGRRSCSNTENGIKADDARVSGNSLLEISKLAADKIAGDLLIDTSLYNQASLHNDDGKIIISDLKPPAGLYFKYRLNPKEHYSIKITGKGLKGHATLRIRKNESEPEYFSAPEGIKEFWVSEIQALELLIYADIPFSYSLSRIDIEKCAEYSPECKVDKDLYNKILVDLPELKKELKTDRFKAARSLLDWVSNSIDWALSKEIAYDTNIDVGEKNASDIYYRIFTVDKGAVLCGGSAVFFNKVARLFGFNSFTINFGELKDNLTHVTCIIAFPHDNQWRYYIFDPTFNATFRLSGTQEYATFSDLIVAAKKKKYSRVWIEEMPLNQREYLALIKDSSRCENLERETEIFVVCSNHYDINSFVNIHKSLLIRNGFETELPAVYLQLMTNRVFSVGRSHNPIISKRFSELLQNAGIPIGMP